MKGVKCKARINLILALAKWQACGEDALLMFGLLGAFVHNGQPHYLRTEKSSLLCKNKSLHTPENLKTLLPHNSLSLFQLSLGRSQGLSSRLAPPRGHAQPCATAHSLARPRSRGKPRDRGNTRPRVGLVSSEESPVGRSRGEEPELGWWKGNV